MQWLRVEIFAGMKPCEELFEAIREQRGGVEAGIGHEARGLGCRDGNREARFTVSTIFFPL